MKTEERWRFGFSEAVPRNVVRGTGGCLVRLSLLTFFWVIVLILLL